MAGRNNAMRRAPVRLTPQNSKAFLRSRQLQRGYRARIHQLKPGFLKTSQAASVPRPLHEFQPRMPVDLLKYFGIRVGDLVQIRFGPDRNKKGVVLETLVNRNRVIVEGCGMKGKVTSPKRGTPGEPALMYVETPIHVTNVAPVDPVTKTITRIKLRRMLTGEFVRLSSKSGSAMPPPVPIATRRDEIAYYKRNILKKLATVPQLSVSTTISRQNKPINDVLKHLATAIVRRQRSLLPSSLSECRTLKYQLHPTNLINRWIQMTQSDKSCQIPSNMPPINVSLP